MVGKRITDPVTGMVFEVVHDFAHRGENKDLLFPPSTTPRTAIDEHVKSDSRPRLPGTGHQTRTKRPQA
jgi:hypothetical protein